MAYNLPLMVTERFLGFAFIFYCATVGTVLVLAPWSPGWDRMLAHLPAPGRELLGLPLLRGGLSGFGLVHLVWCAHDLYRILTADVAPHGETRP